MLEMFYFYKALTTNGMFFRQAEKAKTKTKRILNKN